MHLTSQVSFILVNPQMGENIGAAARGMMNFGLTDLRIVAPRDGWPNHKAIEMSAGAFDHMPAPTVFDTLEQASADLNKLYATTARRRDMVKPVFTPDAAIVDGMAICAEPLSKIGFVFGPERTGLENDDLSRCNAIINVPTHPDFSSLNLGQCVLLIAYAISNRAEGTEGLTLPMSDSAPVSLEKMDEFLARLEGALEDGRFFKAEDMKPTMIRNIRNIFMRGDLSDQEVKTLHGIVSALIRTS